jgi:hypothetical protein
MNKLKVVITEAVCKQLPFITTSENWNFDDAIKRWWVTGASSEVLRLTDTGDMCFQLAEIECYKYDFMPKMPVQGSYYNYMSTLGKKIKCPYYLGVNKIDDERKKPYIKLYDSKIAMMVSLYGDIDSYLKSVKVKK